MRYCPICGDTRSQQYLGKWGPDAVMRCGICGIEYYRDLDDDPIISKSEWGSYRYDGEADMKVLRKRAEGAVRYFNKGGKPRVDMQTNVFGYPFSIIDNGKLVDTENAYKGNVIIRALSYGGGIYEGKVTLSYNDDYNDGRGQGGAGCILIGDVRDVRIENGFLVISGVDLGKPISYAYRIQERPDDKKFVFPIPKGGKVPEEKPVPKRQPTIDDFGPSEPPKPKPKKEAPKPVPKSAPKAEPKPTPKPTIPKSQPKKPEPKKPAPIPAPKVERKKGSLVYEVRVDGKLEGSFSSQSKAEALKRDLKKRGLKARVYGVRC